MRGLTPLRGTWLAVMVMLVPVLFATVASATPWQPPEPGSQPVIEAAAGPAEAAETATSMAGTPAVVSQHVLVSDDPDSDIGESSEGDGQPDELNHGQIVRNAHDLTDGVRGCVNRQIAQSDLGKRNADADGDGPVLLEDGTVDPDSIDLECVNGGGNAGDAEEQSSTETDPRKDVGDDEPKSDGTKDEKSDAKDDETSTDTADETSSGTAEPPAKGTDEPPAKGKDEPPAKGNEKKPSAESTSP